MGDIAIRAERLSKFYTIGKSQARYKTFGETLAEGIMAPVRGLRRRITQNPDGADEQNDSIWALKDVSFDVKRGDVVGIIGRNGAGKSTLLKILSRITEPTSGSVDLYGRVGSLLEVGTGFHAELTGRENTYLNGAILGMKRTEIDRKFDEIVAFSEVEKFIDTPVKHYSSGMYLRLAFAVAAHLEPEILLVDEVLAVGDTAFQKKCLGKMGEVASQGRTVLFVSHNLDAIISICPLTLMLDKGVCVFAGETEQAVKQYLGSISSQGQSGSAHVLYQYEGEGRPGKAFIQSIECLSTELQPKPDVYTWDDLVLRVHYFSERDFEQAQIVIELRDYKQQRLVVLDSGPKVPIREGEHWVDCAVMKLPLTAGEYWLGAGIALALSEWLWREALMGQIRIYARDVFDIGRPPVASRMAVAVEHEWRAG